MQYRAALAVAALAPLAAAHSITVTSQCSFPVYLWNVVEAATGNPTKMLNAGESWSGDFTSRADQGGGPCIKLKKDSNIWEAGNLAQVEYKLDPTMNTLFYDLSLINGDPFTDDLVTMSVPSRSDCPAITCQPGANPCPDAYYHPDDPQTKACNNGGGDVQVNLCGGSSGGGSSGGSSGGSGSSSSSSSGSSSNNAPSKAPAPAAPAPTTLQQKPSSAAYPAASDGGNFLEEGQGGAVIVTSVVVVATTVTKHMPPSDAPAAKREAHMHQHLRHGHSRVMGRHAH